MIKIIEGVLTNGKGEIIPNCKIELIASQTSKSVIKASDAVFTTNDRGYYHVEVYPCSYSVYISALSRYELGTIRVYADSQNGSLNDFLTAPRACDLTPEILHIFNQIKTEMELIAKEHIETIKKNSPVLSVNDIKPDEKGNIKIVTDGIEDAPNDGHNYVRRNGKWKCSDDFLVASPQFNLTPVSNDSDFIIDFRKDNIFNTIKKELFEEFIEDPLHYRLSMEDFSIIAPTDKRIIFLFQDEDNTQCITFSTEVREILIKEIYLSLFLDEDNFLISTECILHDLLLGIKYYEDDPKSSRYIDSGISEIYYEHENLGDEDEYNYFDLFNKKKIEESLTWHTPDFNNSKDDDYIYSSVIESANNHDNKYSTSIFSDRYVDHYITSLDHVNDNGFINDNYNGLLSNYNYDSDKFIILSDRIRKPLSDINKIYTQINTNNYHFRGDIRQIYREESEFKELEWHYIKLHDEDKFKNWNMSIKYWEILPIRFIKGAYRIAGVVLVNKKIDKPLTIGEFKALIKNEALKYLDNNSNIDEYNILNLTPYSLKKWSIKHEYNRMSTQWYTCEPIKTL